MGLQSMKSSLVRKKVPITRGNSSAAEEKTVIKDKYDSVPQSDIGEMAGDYALSGNVSYNSKQFAGKPKNRYDGVNSRASGRSKGTRIYNYNEDDALNQSYIERVIGQTPNKRDLRTQSIDYLGQFKQIKTSASKQQFATVERDVRGSLDQIEQYQSPLIDEVKNNNYGKVDKIIGQFIRQKNDSSTIKGRMSQQRQRNLRNSFQPGQEIRVRSNINRSSAQMAQTLNSEYHGAVGPKTKINVPKQFILYQISKNLDSMVMENKMQNSNPTDVSSLEKDFLEMQRSSRIQNRTAAQSYLDFIENPAINQSQNISNSKRPFIGRSSRNMIVSQSIDATHLRNLDNGLAFKSLDNSPTHMVDLPLASPSPALTNFHITDLLERSIMIGSQQKEKSKLKQIIDFYKRQVKPDKEYGHNREIMIRNYRLHLVKDPVAEGIDANARALLVLNKGTTIHVGNSILRPEIHKYTTKVLNMLPEIYPVLKNDVVQHRRGSSMAQSRISDKFYDHFVDDQGEIQLFMEEKEMMEQDQRLESLAEEEQSVDESQVRYVDQVPQYQEEIIYQGDDGVSSRPFTAADAEEMNAIALTNRVFDKWLRNIVSSQSTRHPESPTRLRLGNGQLTAPRLADINWQIAIQTNTMIKEKPLPMEMLTSKSFYDEKPYRHLQMLMVNQDVRDWYSRFVMKTQSVKTYSQIARKDLQSMSFQDCKVAIDFCRNHLTHVDPLIFGEDRLPFELYVDFGGWIKPVVDQLIKERKAHELNSDYQGIPAKTEYFFKDGQRKLIKAYIYDYDPISQRFLLQNRDLKITTWRSRIYLRLQTDSKKRLDEQKHYIFQQRAEALNYLRVHRLINDELLKRYNYIKLPNQVLLQIQQRFAINVLSHNLDTVRKLILQIEALYVFAILKSTLSSQKHDPFIRGLLAQYKVPLDTPALTYFRPHHKEKIHLRGIEDYHMKGMKIELDHNSLLLMSPKYIKLPLILNKLTQETIGELKLFSVPFDVEKLFSQRARDFRKVKTREDLDQMVNLFPLRHDEFVKAQRVMSHHFHQVAKYQWAESLSQRMMGYVEDDFDFNQGNCMTMDEVDPSLMRLLYQLKLYMQTVMFEYFQTALRDYMKFLLSFMLRDPEMKDSKIVAEVKHNPWIDLGVQGKFNSYHDKYGQIINDAELIPVQTKPMIKISALIEDFVQPNKIVKKQKIATSPELETVHKDLFSVILTMHSSLEEIERVDGMIFPLLKVSSPYLEVPDAQSNERLSHYIRLTEKLLERSLKSTKKELSNIGQLMTIFDKKVDNLILDLKRRSFQMQQETSMAEAGSEAQGTTDGQESMAITARNSQTVIEKEGKKRKNGGDEEEDESSGAHSDEEHAEGDGEGYQGNDMAYKSVEIDDGLFRQELYHLRLMVWKILESVRDEYDFGLVHLDCTKFKERILKHNHDLIEHLENHIKNDFLHKLKNIQYEIVAIKGKLDMEVESIDDVIMLLDYIESLKKQDNKIGDIASMISELAKRMEYINSVETAFPGDQYYEFLHIRNWPFTFKRYIEERKEELLSKKDDLYLEMSVEIDHIFDRIESFKATMRECISMGLGQYDPAVEEALSSTRSPAALQSALSMAEPESPDKLQDSKRLAEEKRLDARGKTFFWLAREIDMPDKSFEPYVIQSVFKQTQQLKLEFDEVERATTLINKRETLLGVQCTEFSELKTIHDNLKPLYELWHVASKFGQIMPGWVEEKFENIDAAYVELKTEEWLNELKRLQKTSLVQDNPKQQELQKFMIESLHHFKKYGPMLRTMRTKGLAGRHWKTIGSKLSIQIEPGMATLYRLIMLELYDEEKLKVIKQVCEVATKEYAVQLALDGLEDEMQSAEFEFEYTQDGQTIIVTKLPEVVAMFEDFFLRVSVLKTNPNIKNFFDKLLEVERIIKSVVELVSEWADFQRNFIYLNSIFALGEIQKALTHETKLFYAVQSLYEQTTDGFKQSPQVYRINMRENFLNTLIRRNQECEQIRAGLRVFLEKKRGKFPRLYFLSNEELIDIFGRGAELVDSMIAGQSRAFITNLFEGVDQIHFRGQFKQVTHMSSKDGEEVALVQPVLTEALAADAWLSSFEQTMMQTIKHTLFLAFEKQGQEQLEDWVANWPGQATFLSSQVWFTMKVHSIFMGNAEKERDRRLLNNSPNLGESDIEQESEKDSQSSKSLEEERPTSDLQEGALNQDPPDDEQLDFEDERAYLEEVHRQIAKDEVSFPERAQLEKVLRLKQRFRIDKKKPTLKQMEQMLAHIQNQIIQYTSMVKKRMKSYVRKSTVALLTCHVYQRDNLGSLIRDRVQSKDEFGWQIQFKFDIKGLGEAVARSAFENHGKSRNFETHRIHVDFEAFGTQQRYGFEYLGNCPRLVITPLTERCQRSLLVALQYHYGGAPEGPFGTGKTETTKDLSRQIAKLCFVLNCSATYEYAGVCRFFKGLASSGLWVCFDEFNRMDSQVLSLISQVIIALQSALKSGAPQVLLEDTPVKLRPDCAVFITMNPGYAGRTELPMNLKALFRSVSMVAPDSIFITEILLYSSGFVGAQQLAKKIVSIQNWGNIMLNKPGVPMDFGLRSIKSIIAIAEALKLQACNIVDSELTEIIDDNSLTQIPYKADQIIKDIMTSHQKKVNRQVRALLPKKDDHGAAVSKHKTRMLGDQPGSAVPSALDDFDDDAEGLFDVEDVSEEDSAFGDVQAANYPPVQKGELYKQLWNRKKYRARQTRALYKSIGLNPDYERSEEELEEYIILKAVRDFNHSKFSAEEHIIVEGLIKDVFQSAIPDLDAPIQDYGNLQEALEQSFEMCKYDKSENLKKKALQFYEIVNSKHGCLFLGKAQSGKTTLINLLESALNKAALNEFQLTIQDRRRAALIEITKELEPELVAQALARAGKDENKGGRASDMMGAAGKKAKRSEKEGLAKKILAQYEDMYKRTKLTVDEIDEIRNNLRHKGVRVRRMNPKAMTMKELFGACDDLSHEWQEGLFTQEFRAFANMHDAAKKWILLDGPIDYTWVENLNSILDDNRKMSLPNGEHIKMTEGTCILLETTNLNNVTPATVSRCGLIYLDKSGTCDSKAIFNQWLRNLPPNLAEYSKEIEAAANYLMVEAISVFNEDQASGNLSYSKIDLHWLIQSFVRLLTTLIFDYFLEYEKSNAMNGGAPTAALGSTLLALTLANKWTDTAPDPNMTVFPPNADEETAKWLPSREGSRTPSQQRAATPGNKQLNDFARKLRLPKCNFIDNEIRYENALKFTPVWLEAFVIFSLVWTFYPALSERGRKLLDSRLQAKYNAARSDFGVYQREKKRKMQEKNREKTASFAKTLKQQSMLESAQSGLQSSPYRASNASEAENAPLETYTPTWTDASEVKPMLISNFPEAGSFFDYFFNLDASEWVKFNVNDNIAAEQETFQQSVPSQQRITNLFVPSEDTIRYSYILECLVTKQTSTIVVGPTCCGRSTLLRRLLFDGVYDYTREMLTEHVTLSQQSDSVTFKDTIEHLLEWRHNEATGESRLVPPEDNKLVCYIEDIHMSQIDAYGDQTAIEAIRDYLTAQAWLSSRKRRLRRIENVTFFACMSTNAPESAAVTERVLHRFNLVALDNYKPETVGSMIKTMMDTSGTRQWPSAAKAFSKNIVDALVDISQRVFSHLKPTPKKAHYTFCWRDLRKIAICLQMVEGNSLKNEENVMSLFYHECLRTYGDRLLMSHDNQWFLSNLEEVCRKHFNVVTNEQIQAYNKLITEQSLQNEQQEYDHGQRLNNYLQETGKFQWPIKDPKNLFYSHWNNEVEGFYMQVDKIEDIDSVIERNLSRFNDSNERVRLDLMLYNQLSRQMLKMLRVITAPNGHLVHIALKGFGLSSAVKLVAFTGGHTLRQVEIHEQFTDEEWKSDLRQALVTCATEDKPLTFYVDEYQIKKESWYTDLECLLKNGISSDITRKSDILAVLTSIYKDIQIEKEGMGAAMRTAEEIAIAAQERESRLDTNQEPEGDAGLGDGKKLLFKYPHIQADMYKVFLNRIKTNFHLILQLSPTGANFREKLTKHVDLLYCSQILFMRDLAGPELESLGKRVLEKQYLHDQEKRRLAEDQEIVISEPTVDRDSQNKALKCAVKIYLQAQDAARKFGDEYKMMLQFTPVHFIRIFKCQNKLMKERHTVVQEISQRYDAGLMKIKQTQEAIYAYHQELERRGPQLQNRMRQLFRIINDIEEEFTRIKGVSDQLKRDEFEVEGHTQDAQRILDACEDTLNKIIPTLNQVMNSLESLNKHDIAELKSMQKPPKVVKLVFEVVCIFLNVPPAEKRSKKTGAKKMSYWKAAQGPLVLGNPRLSQVLMEFDRNKITPEIMMKVETVLKNPEYSYAKAYTASKAATGMFKWVKATRDYFYIFKEVEPRRDAFMLSNKQLLEKKKQLEEKQARIQQLDTALIGLKEHQQSKDGIINALQEEIQECNLKKKRADTLLRGLSAEKQKWVVCMRMLAAKSTSVTGDVLLTSGFITLLSAFPLKYRLKCVEKWSKFLNDEGFQCTPEFVFAELFGDSYEIRRWHQNHLPTDTMSVDNALVISKTKRYSLLIDPELQGTTWLKAQSDGPGGLYLLKQTDSNFKKMMELAIEVGKTVIIEQIDQFINMNLQSIMKKQVSKHGGARMITFCRKQYKYDKNFQLYVVSQAIKPQFDVNITNHVTLVNFSINQDSLQAQMLTMVVMNERSDLENTFSENQKEAFESIKALKEIEKVILSQLENEVDDLLGDENLIRLLNESKNTAEYVASKLKNITITNQFIQKSRNVYAPVAYRASILYFVAQDLQRINRMYQFSLNWFKETFKKSIEMTNVAREASGDSKNPKLSPRIHFLENVKFTLDERIELLTKTFTQEFFKKIMMAVFEEDRALVSGMLTLRVLRSENLLEPSLFDFLMRGPQRLPKSDNQLKGSSPWMNTMVRAELDELCKLRPFTERNLVDHMKHHPAAWNTFQKASNSSFDDLPNKELIDIKSILDDEVEVSLVESKVEQKEEAGPKGDTGDSETVNSEQRPMTGSIKRSESEILNDPNIWNVTETEDEDQIDTQEERKKSDLGSQDLDEDDKEESRMGPEYEMAKYLIEAAPAVTRATGGASPAQEKDNIQKGTLRAQRERTIKALCELCVLRCIRPDQLLLGLERLTSIVLDPNYSNWKRDLLHEMVKKKKYRELEDRLAGPSDLLIEEQTQVLKFAPNSGTHSGRSSARQLELSKKMSGTVDVKQPGSTSHKFKEHTQDSQMLEGSQTRRSKASLQSKKQKQTEGGEEEIEPKEKKDGIADFNRRLNEAYHDSDAYTPMLFLITHSVDIVGIVEDFRNRLTPPISAKVQVCTLGKGLEKQAESNLIKAAYNGDWVILENLHLVEDWLPTLEDLIARWRSQPDHSPRFRLWATSASRAEFPPFIVQKSIKLAIQPPKTIKQRADVMMKLLAREGGHFRNSRKYANFHKNIFFALIYFHAILAGRKNFGTIGWNLPYMFDLSDFEVSSLQLSDLVSNLTRSSSPSRPAQLPAALSILTYFFSQINYGGKIQRAEDQVLLEAILAELVNEESSSVLVLPPNPSKSHFGIPPEGHPDYSAFLRNSIPESDPYEVYGFNSNMARSLVQKEAFTLIDRLGQLEFYTGKKSKESSNQTPNNCMELSATKVSLRVTPGTKKLVKSMLQDKNSILSLLIAIQKLLRVSSLDTTGESIEGRRYDHNIDQPQLAVFDENDKQVGDCARRLLQELDKALPTQTLLQIFPIKYGQPLNNIVNKEVNAYKLLLRAIRDSVAELIAASEGQCSSTLQYAVQENRVPETWLAVSFKTAHTSLADYLVELGAKLSFWNQLAKSQAPLNMPCYWLPAFTCPVAFLNTLAQRRARLEAVPISEVLNVYEVMPFMTPTEPCLEPYSLYFDGCWLEGADWDLENGLLVETTRSSRFVQFPVVKLSAVRRPGQPGQPGQQTEGVLSELSAYPSSRSPSKASKVSSPRKKSTKPRLLEKSAPTPRRIDPDQESSQRSYVYVCPVYRSINRLSAAGAADERTAVCHLRLNSLLEPSHWLKRGVALLLEPDYAGLNE